MISVEAALKLINNPGTMKLNSKEIRVEESLNMIIATDVFAPINMPPFQQSAMDGYAINYKDDRESYNCIGEVAAGESKMFNLLPGEAVRIFTGGMVPLSANMVIRQEDAVVEKTKIIFSIFPKVGANIRPEGEQILKDEVALESGTLINPAALGFLASIGVSKISVVNKPKIAVVSTGDELVESCATLLPGQIYESNAKMLLAALKEFGFTDVDTKRLKDNFEATNDMIRGLISEYDLIIFSGGISVGDYDFVGKGLKKNEVTEIFYKVKQKPGKPIFYGQKNDTNIFALPGNPAACLTCFYIYVLPVLNQLSGFGFNGLEVGEAKLTEIYHRKGDRGHFLKALHKAGKLSILEGQSSAMLKSFALANALVYIPHDKTSVTPNELVRFYKL